MQTRRPSEDTAVVLTQGPYPPPPSPRIAHTEPPAKSSALAAARSFLDTFGLNREPHSQQSGGRGVMGCVYPLPPRFPHTTEDQGLEVTAHWRRRSVPEHAVVGGPGWSPERGGSLPTHGDGGHLSSWAEHDRQVREAASRPDPTPVDIPVEVDPTPLPTGEYLPEMSEASSILHADHLRALASTVPLRHKWRFWQLLYSTARDGISLQTLYRRSPSSTPTVLIVRDRQGHTFGCFTSEAWRVSKRYYGTGESFVFQIKPHTVFWPWHQKRMAQQRNDFFQFSTSERLAIGGAPKYALCLDADLNRGSSGLSETFGSPCLASEADFEIGRVELWGLF